MTFENPILIKNAYNVEKKYHRPFTNQANTFLLGIYIANPDRKTQNKKHL